MQQWDEFLKQWDEFDSTAFVPQLQLLVAPLPPGNSLLVSTVLVSRVNISL